MDPRLVLDAGGVTHGVAALDLTVVVPPMILGAHWLWRSRPWGHVISAGMLVQGLLIVADLLVTAPFHSAARIPHAWTMVPLWAAMGAGFAAGAALLLWPRRRGGVARAAAAGMLLCAVAPAQALDAGARLPNAIEVSPISPLMHIYAVQYARALDERNEVIVGLAYADIPQKAVSSRQPRWMDAVITPNTRTHDVGTNHSTTVFVGYRRYLWRGLHAEYQLWPGYNEFWSDRDRRYYSGFDLWNELRVGYTVDFALAGASCFVNLQYLFGFGLVRGNKPSDFGQEGEQTFRAPVFFVGARF